MKKINAILVQNQAIIGDKLKNFQKVELLLRPFEKQKVDIIVLPELFALGWECKIFKKHAEKTRESETCDFLSKLAKKFNANLIGGSFIREQQDGSLKNSMPIFDRDGNLVCFYDKMHLYSYLGDSENLYIKQGDALKIVEFDCCNVGVSLCYDIRFCEVFRTLTLNGADILINSACWPKSRKHHYDSLCSSRAIENQSFFIGLSQVGLLRQDIYNLGSSFVLNPVGEKICSLSETLEQAKMCEICLEEQTTLREKVKTLYDIHKSYPVNFVKKERVEI